MPSEWYESFFSPLALQFWRAVIPPEATRSWRPGDRGVRLIAIGGTPGKAYQPRT